MREGRVVSKEHMVNHLYGWGDEVGTNAMEVYVYRVRKKLESYRLHHPHHTRHGLPDGALRWPESKPTLQKQAAGLAARTAARPC